jgi:hypothetical protein
MALGIESVFALKGYFFFKFSSRYLLDSPNFINLERKLGTCQRCHRGYRRRRFGNALASVVKSVILHEVSERRKYPQGFEARVLSKREYD